MKLNKAERNELKADAHRLSRSSKTGGTLTIIYDDCGKYDDFGKVIELLVPWPLARDEFLKPQRFAWLFPGQRIEWWRREPIWGILFVGDEIRGFVSSVARDGSIDPKYVNPLYETNLVVPNIWDPASVQLTFERVVEAVKKVRARKNAVVRRTP